MQCPYCREQIHDRARICRFCGKKIKRLGPVGITVAGIFAIAVAVGVIDAVREPASSGSVAPRASASADDSIPVSGREELAKRFVSPHLRDPASAQYRNVSYRTRRSIPVFCGEVNSTNGFGGRTGYQRFVLINQMLILQEEARGSEMRNLWNLYCVRTDAQDKDWPKIKAKLAAKK